MGPALAVPAMAVVRSVLVAATWLVLASASLLPAPGRPGRRNVLLIAVDDLRAEFGETYAGGAWPGRNHTAEVLTPHIDAFASTPGTVVFTRAFCQAATCGISRASLMTGRRPDTTHVLTNGACPFTTDPAHQGWVSLPRVFRDSGYTTQGMGKVYHPGVCDGEGAGEECGAWSLPYFHAPTPWACLGEACGNAKEAKQCKCPGSCSLNGSRSRGVHGASPSECHEHTTVCSCSNGAYFRGTCDGGAAAKRANSFWANATSTGADTPDGQVSGRAVRALRAFGEAAAENSSAPPFFLAVGLHKPHLPHIAPKRFFDLYDEGSISLPEPSHLPTGFPIQQWFACGEALSYSDWKADAVACNFSVSNPLSADSTRRHRLAYFAALSFTDSLVGDVIDALSSAGTALVESTVTVLLADHGWSLGVGHSRPCLCLPPNPSRLLTCAEFPQENNEWGKHTPFVHSNHVPLIIRLPGSDAKARFSRTWAENVDIMPTLAELAGLKTIPVCTSIEDSRTNPLCTEGRSLAPVVLKRGGFKPKVAAFWQWTKHMIERENVMAYAMATDQDGSTYRYTEWVGYKFNSSKTGGLGCEGCGNFSQNHGTELYNLTSDSIESVNLAGEPSVAALQEVLSARLRAGWRAI